MIESDEILTSFEKGLLTDRAICTDAIASKKIYKHIIKQHLNYYLIFNK